MKNPQKGFANSLLVVAIAIIVIAVGVYLYFEKNDSVQVDRTDIQTGNENNNSNNSTSTQEQFMFLDLYIQNKEIARTSDCRVTQKVTYQVSKTTAVADASLRILFTEELARYGVYKSVSITNGVAKVTLQSDMTPAGYPIGGLSSCEKGHLLSVLSDTLKQYKTIKSVEIFSPNGKIEF